MFPCGESGSLGFIRNVGNCLSVDITSHATVIESSVPDPSRTTATQTNRNMILCLEIRTEDEALHQYDGVTETVFEEAGAES